MPGPGVRGTVFPPTIHEAHRRPLGLDPAALLGLLAALVLILALVLFASGAWIAGIIALGATLGVVALFLVAVGREPQTPVSRLALRSLARAGAFRRLAVVGLGAWSKAALPSLRARAHQQWVHWKLRRQLAPLGEAVHLGDEEGAARLKARADLLEREERQHGLEGAAARETARRRIEAERSGAEATVALEAETQPPDDRPRT